MTDQPNPEEQKSQTGEPAAGSPQEERLRDEFRSLGENLVNTLRSAWDSPERQRLQKELESGLNELGSTIRREAEHIKQSPTGQQLRSDVEDLGQRVRSGEAEAKLREELLSALKMINTELEKVSKRWSGGTARREVNPDDVGAAAPPPRPEVHPDDVESGNTTPGTEEEV